MLKLTDVKDIVEKPTPSVLSETLLNDYKLAPQPRQLEIYRFLVSTALNQDHPDIVRQNSYNVLGAIKDITDRQVIIDSANEMIERLGRRTPSLLEARVAHTSGIFPYLKQSMLIDFFKSFLDVMNKIGYSFKSHDKHGELLRNLMEVGGLNNCPDDLLPDFVEWLVLCYIGESSFGQWSGYRKVFNSNTGAPLAYDIIRNCAKDLCSLITALGESSKKVKMTCGNEYVARRYQEIVDLVEN